jgi:hypothetical protein
MLTALVSQGLLGALVDPSVLTVGCVMALAPTTNCTGVTGDPAAPALVCGGGPDERNEINLFSTSNQNGAPRDTANVVASNPTIFNTQPQKSAGKAEVDQPITG